MPTKTEKPSRTVDQVASIYVARRELVPAMRRVLLKGGRGLKLEDAEVLLGLFRAKKGDGAAISPDNEGYIGLRQLEAAQMLSQSQIHRRVSGLILSEYLEESLPRRETAAIKVRLTEKGDAFADQYWKDTRKFASEVLKGVVASEYRLHVLVNDAIQRKILGLSLSRARPTPQLEPVDSLMSVFTAATALRFAIDRAVVLPEDGLSVERADLLIFLHTKRGEFTTFGEIQRNLVHSFSSSRPLLSRWISEMATPETGFIEARPLGGIRREAAITAKGREKIKPILGRYRSLADRLLADIPEPDRKAHLLVNQWISNALRPRVEDWIAADGSKAEPRSGLAL